MGFEYFEYFQQQLKLYRKGQQCEEEAEGYTARHTRSWSNHAAIHLTPILSSLPPKILSSGPPALISTLFCASKNYHLKTLLITHSPTSSVKRRSFLPKRKKKPVASNISDLLMSQLSARISLLSTNIYLPSHRHNFCLISSP